MARTKPTKKKQKKRMQLWNKSARTTAPATGGLKRSVRMSLSGLSFMLDGVIIARNGWSKAFEESLNIERLQLLVVHEKLPLDCAAIIMRYDATQHEIRQNIHLKIQRCTMQINRLYHIISAERAIADAPKQRWPNCYDYKNTSISVVYDDTITKDDTLLQLF